MQRIRRTLRLLSVGRKDENGVLRMLSRSALAFAIRPSWAVAKKEHPVEGAPFSEGMRCYRISLERLEGGGSSGRWFRR